MNQGKQFFVFIVVGVFTAVVDVSAMEWLIYSGQHYGIAASIGFTLGLVVNYFCHSHFTFSVRVSSESMLRFGFVVFINYLITMFFIFVSQRFLGSVLIGKIASLPVVAMNGFMLSRYWVFK